MNCSFFQLQLIQNKKIETFVFFFLNGRILSKFSKPFILFLRTQTFDNEGEFIISMVLQTACYLQRHILETGMWFYFFAIYKVTFYLCIYVMVNIWQQVKQKIFSNNNFCNNLVYQVGGYSVTIHCICYILIMK